MKTTVSLVLMLAILFAPVAAQDWLEKGQPYTIVVPSDSVEFEGRSRWGDRAIYGARLHADPEWANLPHVVRSDFHKQEVEDDFRIYEFRTDDQYFKLRLPTPDLVASYVAPATDEQALIDQAISAAAAVAFVDTTIPEDLWLDVARYAVGLGAQRLEQPVAFRGGEYLVLNIGQTSVYNSARLNETHRLARTISDLIDRVKTVDALGDIGLAGMRIDAEIPHYNFVTDSPLAVDEMMWYVGSELIPALRDFEITSQDLVDQSVVVANGTRVEVNLADQG